MAQRRRISKAGTFLKLFWQAADFYRVRILAACCAALLLMNLAFYLPADFGEGRIGFRSGFHMDDELRLDVHRTPRAIEENVSMNALATDHTPTLDAALNDAQPADESADAAGESSLRDRPLTRLESHNMLTVAEEQPQFVGGIGRYYFNIDYPDEAREAGIQGRLVLRFTVGVDGLARDIEIEESLHPACDSSAVAALRRSHFIPGRVDGERVPMRLRLPVRFELVDTPADQLLTDSKPQ